MGTSGNHTVTARIGMVNFINTAPLYEVWQKTVQQPQWRVKEAPPATLNRMLHGNELDLGFVSSHEYAVHSQQYKILSDLSISATGPVGSVFLFSEKQPEELSGCLIHLSAQSQTSVSLVKILLEEFYQVRPYYAWPGERGRAAAPEKPAAVLAIGDEALRLAAGGAFPVALDLSEAWYRCTGLPFVFAVWAVREDFCRQDPDSVVAIHQELLRCLRQGRRNLREISEAVAPRIPMPPEDCYAYLRKMEYDLDGKKQEALKKYFEYLIKRGEADEAALPLKICG